MLDQNPWVAQARIRATLTLRQLVSLSTCDCDATHIVQRPSSINDFNCNREFNDLDLQFAFSDNHCAISKPFIVIRIFILLRHWILLLCNASPDTCVVAHMAGFEREREATSIKFYNSRRKKNVSWFISIFLLMRFLQSSSPAENAD